MAGSGPPAEFRAAVAAAERKLAGVDTLYQRDAANELYDAWYEVAKLHATRRLEGGSEAMRETTLTMLRRIVRKGTNFMGHSLADDFVVLAMLQHVAKVLQLLREKPKFLALLAVSATADPPMADFGGSMEQRRSFADALPAAFLEEVMATATDTTLGTQRRAGALEAVRQVALLAAAVDKAEPAALTGTALSRSVSAEVIASIAMAAGSDMILRQASMAALKAAAGADSDVYAPRVAKALLSRTSDATILVPVWSMGALRSGECVDLVTKRIRKDWSDVARRSRGASASAEGSADPSMAGVAQGGLLGIAGGGGTDVGMAYDTVVQPGFAKAVLESLFESLLSERSGEDSGAGLVERAGSATSAAATSSSQAAAKAKEGVTFVAPREDGESGAAAPVASSTSVAAMGVLRILGSTDAPAAILSGAVPSLRLLGKGGRSGGLSDSAPTALPSLPAEGSPGRAAAVAELLGSIDMSEAPERSGAWLDLARLVLELRPNDRALLSLLLLYPTHDSLELVTSSAGSFSPTTWAEVLLPWASARLAAMPAAVSGAPHDQAVVDAVREWLRCIFEISAFSHGIALPPSAVGREFFRVCLLAMSRGYAETQRFPEAAASVVSAYVTAGQEEALSWMGDAVAPGIARTTAAVRASTELLRTLLGADANEVLGDHPAARIGAAEHEEVGARLMASASSCLSPGALALWHALGDGPERHLSTRPGMVAVFASAVHAELDKVVARMQGNAEFAEALLRPADVLHESNIQSSAEGRIAGFTAQAGRWTAPGGAAAGAAAGAEALAALAGASTRDAAAAATAAAEEEVRRLSAGGDVGLTPFDPAAASFAVLPAGPARRKVIEIVDATRAVASSAPAAAAAPLFTALLKAVALLPPDMEGSHRADAEAAKLISSIALAQAATHEAATRKGLRPRPPLPPAVVEEALTSLGPQARCALAALFPATCLIDDDTLVRVTALHSFASATSTPVGASLATGRAIVVALLVAMPNDDPAPDNALMELLGLPRPPPVRTPEGKPLEARFARFTKGFSRPTREVLDGSSGSMTDVQLAGAGALAAVAVAVARVATGEGSGSHAWSVDAAAGVAAACLSRLLLAAADTALNDASSAPSPAVVASMGTIARLLPEAVLDAMVTLSSARALLGDLRRASPHWAAAIAGMVHRGVLVPRVVGTGYSKRSSSGQQPGVASDPMVSELVGRGAASSGLPMRWGSRRRAGTGSEEDLCEFELAPASTQTAEGVAERAMAASGNPEYASVLERFRAEAETAGRAAAAQDASSDAPIVTPLPSAPPALDWSGQASAAAASETTTADVDLLGLAGYDAPGARAAAVGAGAGVDWSSAAGDARRAAAASAAAATAQTGREDSWMALRSMRAAKLVTRPTAAASAAGAAAGPAKAARSGDGASTELSELMFLLPAAPVVPAAPVASRVAKAAVDTAADDMMMMAF